MFGFPVNLQDSGVQKFTNDADNGFPKIQQREVFYSVKDGDWTDRTIWQTASGRVGLLPGQFDDVYIKNYVSTNFPANSNYFCNNLFVSKESTLRMIGGGGAINLHIFGNIRCFGTLQQTGQYSVLHLYQNDNYIDKSTNLTNIEIRYRRDGDQDIIDLQYYVLNIFGGGNKKINSNLYVSNNFTLWSDISKPLSLDLKGFDFYCGGTATIQALLIKQGPGNLTIVGNFSLSSATLQFNNVNVEMRGGLGCLFSNINDVTGTWTFTTNNQNIAINNTSPAWNCNFIIDGPITITNTNTGQAFVLNNTINGTNALSKLVNNGIINFNSATSVPSMTTGIWDFTTNANTIGYTGNYTATIPSYFTIFHNLTISGTGIKSLGVDTTINGNLSISGIVTPISLDLSSYALNVIGMTFGNLQTNIIRSVSNSGKIARFADLSGSYGSLGINVGNTNDIEINGTSITNASNSQIYIVCRNLTFLTSITTSINFYGSTQSQIQNVIIGSGVTFNNNGALVSSTLNGVDGTSIFNNNSSGTYILNSNSTFMSTGVFNQNGSIVYNFNATRTIEFTSFVNLQIWSTSGLFTLSNNTNVSGFLTINNFAGNNILQLSNYDLIILGTIGIAGGSPINRNVANSGKILSFGSFAGNYGTCTIDVGSTNDIDVTGTSFSNPANGTMILSGRNVTFKASATLSLSNYVTINGNMIIDNSIIINTSTSGNFYINGTLIGNNSSSSFICRNVLQYNASTQPMATGILDTSTNLNTFIYGSGNQDIKGGPTTGAKQVYRNLTLNGGGTKTLQGYCSVLNTYTLTSPATLNLNGYTLTNP